MTSYNVGIIGAGNIAIEHLKVINKIRSLKLYSIYSRTISKARKLALKYNIKKTYKSLEEILNDNNIQCFIILVSSENIYKITKKVIISKKPFFVEKPIALNNRDYLSLKKLCIKNNTLNMVGYNRRFYSILDKSINIIRKYGGISSFHIEGHERIWKLKKTFNNKILNSWIYANSIHTIDMLSYFGGDIAKISHFTKKTKNNFIDNISMNIKFKNGIIGSYISYWNSPDGWSISLYGDGIKILIKPLEEAIWIDKKFKKRIIKPSVYDQKYKVGFYNQMKSFKNMLDNNKLDSKAAGISESHQNFEILRLISK